MIKLAFSNLLRHKSRTAISMVGIVIGVAAIVTLVAMVDGAFSDVENAVGQVQGIMVIQDGAAGALFSKIDEQYVDQLESMPSVRAVIPQIIALARSVGDNRAGQGGIESLTGGVRLIGIDYSKARKARALPYSASIVSGYNLEPGERGKIVIGEELSDQLNKFVGSKLEINDKDFKIKGIYKTGSSMMNSSVLLAINDIREIIDFPLGKVAIVDVDLVNPENETAVASTINFRFKNKLKARSSSAVSDMFGDILGSFRLMVAAIAAVSAIVAGIGIINTMLMSVLERFKEIGSLKAAGWTNDEIIKMVMYESAFVGVLGGIAGIILGSIIALSLGSAFELSVALKPDLLLGSFFFAVVVGLIAGAYPSFLAAKMNPVDALRME